MKNAEDIDMDLMIAFLRAEFPKRRIKSRAKSKRFTQGIVIPSHYTNSQVMYFPLKDSNSYQAAIYALVRILEKFFSFDIKLIDRAVRTYL
jgi:hypothetical protein